MPIVSVSTRHFNAVGVGSANPTAAGAACSAPTAVASGTSGSTASAGVATTTAAAVAPKGLVRVISAVAATTGAAPTAAASGPATGNTTIRAYDTGVTPATAAATDDTAYAMGLTFYATQTAWISEIRWFQPSTNSPSSATRSVALWRVDDVSSGTNLSGTVTGSTTVTGWNTVAFSSPIQLTANQQYRATVLHPAGRYAATSNWFDTGTGSTNYVEGFLVVPNTANTVGVDQGSYIASSTMAYPNNSFQGANYWIDVTVHDFNPGSPVTHGSQITTSNTGYAAYIDPTLNRPLVSSDLTRVTGTHWISDFTSGGTGGTSGNPKIVEKLDIDEVLWDVNWVTLRGCNIRQPASAFLNGTHQVGARMEYCTINPATVGDECMHYESWSAHRCQFRGCSDGAKINGGAQPISITECYIGVKMQSADDHNDCVQNVGGTGTVTITRSKLVVAPEGGLITGGSGGPNGCIMSADMSSGSVFSLTATDCYFNGGTSASTVRLYDGGLTTNITYSVTGCLWERTAAPPVDRGTSNTTPTGQITWSNNRWADDLSTISLP